MTSAALFARRLLMAVPTMLVVSMVMFLLLMVGPDPLAMLAQENGNIDTAELARRHGWDRPWHVQYGDWLGGFVTGDWGTSVRTSEPARDVVVQRLPLTVMLTLAATLLSLLAAVTIGTCAAIRHNTRGDRLATATMVAIGAIPGFLLALALQWVAVQLKDLTGHTIVYVGGMPREGGALESVQRFALPILVLSLVQVAAWMRFQRAELLEVLGRDYLTTARGKGLSSRNVVLVHALRNALVPLVTIVALELGTTLGGTVLVETIFGLPGIGRLLIESVQARDVVVALDIIVLGAVAIVFSTAAADVILARLDPRGSVEVRP